MATTIINTPPQSTASESSGNGMGFLIGVLVLLLIVVLFFLYGLPYVTRSISSTQPQVNVPDHVNVNVRHTTK